MSGDKTALGERMKEYERSFRHVLPNRMPTIVRVDGRAFHTVLRHATKPYDTNVSHAMEEVTRALFGELQNAVFAYSQSDEISVLMHPYRKLTTQSWLGNVVQKIVSLSAAKATQAWNKQNGMREGTFDARVFVLPESEVCNYFCWRQQDAIRNSINALGQAHFSPKQLHGKNTKQVQEMLLAQHDVSWEACETWAKRGFCLFGNANTDVDREVPLFSQDRAYVERHLAIDPSDE